MHRLKFIVLLLFQSIFAFSAEENFLLINGETNEIALELGPHINERFSPCSTFKITLSLMGYDARILTDENTPVWDFKDGYDDWLPAWRVPQSPQSWMRYSCVWYSKVLGAQLGLEKMQSYIASMEYGNGDMSGNVAWINSSLTISPREQVDFIQKMVQGKLSVSPSSILMTKALLFKETLAGGWNLYGKTGWSGSDIAREGKILEHSWFVGWIEKDQLFFPFAYLIRDKKINLDQRIPRVKEFLSIWGPLLKTNEKTGEKLER